MSRQAGHRRRRGGPDCSRMGHREYPARCPAPACSCRRRAGRGGRSCAAGGPMPLSMFTTPMPAVHDVSIVSSTVPHTRSRSRRTSAGATTGAATGPARRRAARAPCRHHHGRARRPQESQGAHGCSAARAIPASATSRAGRTSERTGAEQAPCGYRAVAAAARHDDETAGGASARSAGPRTAAGLRPGGRSPAAGRLG
jgi:hypothetical protein